MQVGYMEQAFMEQLLCARHCSEESMSVLVLGAEAWQEDRLQRV